MDGFARFWAASAAMWVLLVAPLQAADDQRQTLTRQAQTAFEVVEHTTAPTLHDASLCVQTQAALLPLAPPGERAQLHYRKGFCELADAAFTHGAGEFADAATELEKGGDAKLAWLARAQIGQAAGQPGTGMSGCSTCGDLAQTVRWWQGWTAYQRGDLQGAGREFAGIFESGFSDWIIGVEAFQQARYSEATAQYRRAIENWRRTIWSAVPTMAARLAPPVDATWVLTELGGTQLLAGNSMDAIVTLDEAARTGPPMARTFYLRARAKELAGQQEPALEDYNLASRTAFANATGLASGEAHLYRGILMYRRKDFARAEAEFTSALNFAIPSSLRTDTEAWRHLSAVAGGSCGISRDFLERALPSVSPFFPKDEARTAAHGCGPAAP